MDDLKRSVNVALHHPLVGIGMNNYRFYSNNNQASHNAYTQVWVEMGFAALPLYVALLIAPLRGLRKAGRTSADGKRSGNAFLAIGLEVSIYGYMVCSFFASVAYLWYAYYLIAFSICLRRLSSTASASSTPPDFQEPADSIAYYDRENPSQSIS
jgi:O-antigen ligase